MTILNDKDEDDFVEEIAASLQENLSSPDIVLLCNLVPSLRGLFSDIMRRVVSNTDLSRKMQRPTRFRRRRLFKDSSSLLISETDSCRAMIFVLHDINWADPVYFFTSHNFPY